MSEEILRIERQIDWLKTASPDDWHRVAVSFDFRCDGPIDPLFWIVRQDACDKATALTIFWKIYPKNFLKHLVEGQSFDDQHPNWQMAQFIAKRLNENGFTKSNIEFEATSYVEKDYEELTRFEQQLDQSPLKPCEDMKLSISGQKTDLNGEFAKRYPVEFHNEEIREEYLTVLQIDHLKKGSPDDWHIVADDWNWDNRLDVLYWIVSQPECDKATALLTFWKGEPTGYEYETEEAEMGDEIYAVAPMLRYISERFNTTGYHRSEIEFNYQVAKGLYTDSRFVPKDEIDEIGDVEELVDRQKEMIDPNVKLHADMKISNIPGRKVGGYGAQSAFYNQFPAYFDIDGSEMGGGSVMNMEGDAIVNPLDEKSSSLDEPISEKNKPLAVATPLENDDASARIRAMRNQPDPKQEKDNVSGLMAWLKRLFGR